MGQGMKQQRGAALVIVLALLTGALVVGISGMQSSLIDERLAGNYRASTQAQMNAEIAAASVLDRQSIKKDSFNDAGKNVTLNRLQAMDWDELDKYYSARLQKFNYGCERNGQSECVYIPLILSEGGYYVVAKGVAGGSGRGRAESMTILLKYVSSGEDATPFGSAVTSCQNITLGGSAKITGGVVAGNDVIVSGNPAPPDSLAAGGEFVFPDWWGNQNQAAIKGYQDSEDGYKFVEKCDSLGVLEKGDKDQSYFDDKASELDVVGAAEWLKKRGLDHYYKQTGKTFTLTGGRGNQDASTSYLGEPGSEISLRVDSDLQAAGRLQRLVVDGTVNIFVDGDFDLGGNTSLEISRGAILNLYVSGKVVLSAGSELALGAEDFMRQDSNGLIRPAVSIYSAYQQDGNGVTIGGSNDTYAAIYVPGSNAVIKGSGALYGGLRAQNIVISGAGSLEHEPKLADYKEGGNGEQGGEPVFEAWE